MLLNISNFAKIKNADINIDSITVIAGLNNTAKSTVGKLLYSYVRTFNNIDQQIESMRDNKFNELISSFYDWRLSKNDIIYDDKILIEFMRKNNFDIDKINIDKSNINQVKELLSNLIKANNHSSYNINRLSSQIDEVAEEIVETYTVTSEELERALLLRNLNFEFYGQLNNLNRKHKGKCRIKLSSNRFIIDSEIKNNTTTKIQRNNVLTNNAILIDNPYIIDNLHPIFEISDHTGELLNFLNQEEKIVDGVLRRRKLNKVYEKMSTIVKGTINKNYDGDEGYMEEDMKEPIKISNLSTGLKTFVILKKLIENGSINNNTILILDEPEVHLHPEWQLVYAELIVLLYTELNLKVLLTTHSPYFLNAIEVFSKKHNVDNVNYYLSEMVDNSVEFKNQNDCLENIYELLANPFQKLENLNYED